MAEKKRLLFLSWFLPPQNTIAAVRTGNMVKELLERGWEITVVTAHLHYFVKPLDMTLARHHPKLHYLFVDDRLDPCQQNILKLGGIWKRLPLLTTAIRRLDTILGLHELRLTRAMWQRCRDLKSGDFDLIMVSGSPFLPFTVAQRLSRRLNCPFVLDYRDPWSQNPSSHNCHWYLRLLEKSILKKAALALSVSPSQAALISKLGGHHEVLSNGFCQLPAKPSTSLPPNGQITIVYTGALYLPTRDITPILAVFQELKRRHCDQVRLRYFGSYAQYVKEKAQQFGVAEMVETHQSVSREEALAAQRDSSLVLVITTIFNKATLYENSIVTGKIFEPMALNKPILLISPPTNDAVKIIEATGCGFHFAGTAIQELADFLQAGQFTCTTNDHISSYSWQHLGAKLDSLLTGLLP